jgi:succinyl-CoA synthetase beta subunit
MNIHEYQAKDILKSYGVRIQEGIVVDTPALAVEAARELTAKTGTGWHVVRLKSTQVDAVKEVVLNLLKT